MSALNGVEMTERGKLEESEVVARRLGKLIGGALPPGWGFVLTLGTYGEENGFVTWISSIERPGAIKMLREMIEKMERGEPDV